MNSSVQAGENMDKIGQLFADALKKAVLPCLVKSDWKDIVSFGKLIHGLETFSKHSKSCCFRLSLSQQVRPIYWVLTFELLLEEFYATAYELEAHYDGDRSILAGGELLLTSPFCKTSGAKKPTTKIDHTLFLDVLNMDSKWSIHITPLKVANN